MVPAANTLGTVLSEWSNLIDHSLEGYLGQNLTAPDLLREAMKYSVFGGGKRLRPILVLLANEACSGLSDAALPAACAVEMVHTYSLIHDDLPAMDDDEYRRGQLTCHRRFDEATAILAGDALQTLAFEILTRIQPPIIAVQCVRELAVAAGPAGMIGGQIDDLNPPTDGGSLEWLERLHTRKTGALLMASLRIGGIVAQATPEQLHGLTEYGRRVGLAFQIADDLLDVEGDPERMGKGARKDGAAGKLTYPGILGIDESRQKAQRLVQEATVALQPFGRRAEKLISLADYIIERDR